MKLEHGERTMSPHYPRPAIFETKTEVSMVIRSDCLRLFKPDIIGAAKNPDTTVVAGEVDGDFRGVRADLDYAGVRVEYVMSRETYIRFIKSEFEDIQKEELLEEL